MFLEIKNKIDCELLKFVDNLESDYGLKSISPVLFSNIKEFISRKGKRVRPILFMAGYLGFSKKEPPGLLRSAISLELLHDFMLVHDDIVDKSDLRRGKPAMHTMLNRHLSSQKDLKFNGQDLAIVVGDVMYAMALEAFLSVKENPIRKEAALRKLIQAAFLTGSGEFIEILLGIKNTGKISKADIYKIYDLKTANYTFSAPLCIGATLAGASKTQVEILREYGISLGRAFQIKDDVIGIFNEESETGKTNIADIQEGKKTILIWYAYNHSNAKDRRVIERIFAKKKVAMTDLLQIRKVIEKSRALDFAREEVETLIAAAQKNLHSSSMNPSYKSRLNTYIEELLSV
jgi:geranylgeranyl diphosphate synthase type I